MLAAPGRGSLPSPNLPTRPSLPEISGRPSGAADPGRGREADGEPLDAADQRDAHRLQEHGVAGRLDVGQPGEDLLEDHGELPPGQVGAEAEVRAGPTEADVGVRVAADVEALGIVEDP